MPPERTERNQRNLIGIPEDSMSTRDDNERQIAAAVPKGIPTLSSLRFPQPTHAAMREM
jgi:hypothetical protein